VSRGGSRGDRPDWDTTPPTAPQLTDVENFVHGSSAKLAEPRLGTRPEADPQLIRFANDYCWLVWSMLIPTYSRRMRFFVGTRLR